MMKKLIILLLPIILFACSNKPNLEARVKQYIKDTVLQNFNDPSSYQFVSMVTDTIRGKDLDSERVEYYFKKEIAALRQKNKDLIEFLTDTIGMASVIGPDDKIIKINKEQIDEIRSHPIKSDSIVRNDIIVNYRAKNKMGALILDEMKFHYYPSTNELKEVAKTEEE